MLDRAARPRPAGPDGRFVAFTFAASEMVVEVSAAGHITYASGAFRSRLGATPESFVGKPPTEMVAPCDQDAMAMALVLLQERGRLLPCIVRLANASRSAAVMAGLKLTPDNRESAVCVTFGLPPAPAALVSQATTAHRILVAAQARMPPPNQGTGRAPADPPGQLALLEITAGDRQALTTVLEEIAPHAITSELAPGRYGVLNPAGEDVSDTVLMLEAALQRRDRHVVMASRQVSLADQGLTTIQATQALRQALATFAKDGTAGTDKAGFQGGLAGYVDNAMLQAASLRRAIAQQDFSILYQPIVALDTRRLHHYEALLRPQRGMSSRSPQEFVALVETVGLADELDMAVAAIVCEDADRAGASIAVNISGHSIQNPAFRDGLLALFQNSRAAREGRMLVEMTETAQVDAMDEVAETARRLRGLGVKFCIDDFGAGTADIRLLRAAPTDIVKLDGSFVPGIIGGGRERAFVTGMVEIAGAAGAMVVAERVETEAEAEAVAAIGAHFGQGWLFGRPAPLPAAPQAHRPARRTGTRESWG